MIFDVLTIFPEMFCGPLENSIIKKAREKGLLRVNLIDIRDYSRDKHRSVDDTPYGGGGGMVMNPQPIVEAVEKRLQLYEGDVPVILMCPQGRRFNQDVARELAQHKQIILICGHYEGIDERVREIVATDEISIGDYVLTGGELPAMVIIDAVARFIPGVLGDPEGAEKDSYAQGLLEHPQYTRPRNYRGKEVPEVLLSGHHENISTWRRREALLRTLVRRDEMLSDADLTTEDRRFLKCLKDRLSELGVD
ncbi:MAG: tRNA (guanosine(37)-N1)-methyltransferase TrmD [Peptococcaceae bacterium]|nr:tRNA (guanosine(37)-N1)-methyltransferase TrmD [Peptococcaceae bacterium]